MNYKYFPLLLIAAPALAATHTDCSIINFPGSSIIDQFQCELNKLDPTVENGAERVYKDWKNRAPWRNRILYDELQQKEKLGEDCPGWADGLGLDEDFQEKLEEDLIPPIPPIPPIQKPEPVDPPVDPEPEPVDPPVDPEPEPVDPPVDPEPEPVDPPVDPEPEPVDPEPEPVEPDLEENPFTPPTNHNEEANQIPIATTPPTQESSTPEPDNVATTSTPEPIIPDEKEAPDPTNKPKEDPPLKPRLRSPADTNHPSTQALANIGHPTRPGWEIQGAVDTDAAWAIGLHRLSKKERWSGGLRVSGHGANVVWSAVAAFHIK